MQIYKTKDYTSFRAIVSNREVNKAHVKKLAASIRKKNLLYIRPVIVNDRMEIIDGQHRVAACNINNISRARQVSCWVEQLRNKRLDFVYERNFCLALDEECPDEAAFERLIGMPALRELLVKCDSKNEYRKQIKALVRK